MNTNPINKILERTENNNHPIMLETSSTHQQPSGSSAELDNGVHDPIPAIREIEMHEQEPNFDIVVDSIAAKFYCGCKLNLRKIAQNEFNVELVMKNKVLLMQLRNPMSFAMILSSGEGQVHGVKDEAMAKIACRRYARKIQKIIPKVTFKNFRLSIVASSNMPWDIDIIQFAQQYLTNNIFESGTKASVSYKCKHLNAFLEIFASGKITVHACNLARVRETLKYIYQLLYEFRKERESDGDIKMISE